MKTCFDTNLFIDLLEKRPGSLELFSAQSNLCVSRITWIELMVGVRSDQSHIIEGMLSGIPIIECDPKVAALAVNIRRQHRLKLPDALIWASAQAASAILFTRDSKDFPSSPDIHIVM